ncbi:MAG: glycosyltransferase [Clostridia bacterium]|nr:glycosyltransferase [Clostridia bacterium]
MVKVSVIVPVYNVEKYIRKCLDSLVNQTLEDIEIIVVNDGSKDSSIDILKEYAEKHNNIKVYEKENGGLSDARNYGLQFATGKYIAFLDSDDYVDVNLYKRMYEKAKAEDSDMVECNFYWVYDNKTKKDIGQKYKGKKQMFEKARVVAWNKLYKKEILEKAKTQFPKGLRYEDVEFFYKLVPYMERVSFIKEPLIYYVQRKQSIVNTQNEKTKDIFTVLDNVIQYYKENNLYEEYKEVIEYTYARLLLCSSFKRMCKIKDKNIRKKLLNETWINLNKNFPNWKENKILNTNLDNKKRYMLSVNRFTYKIYSGLYGILK